MFPLMKPSTQPSHRQDPAERFTALRLLGALSRASRVHSVLCTYIPSNICRFPTPEYSHAVTGHSSHVCVGKPRARPLSTVSISKRQEVLAKLCCNIRSKFQPKDDPNYASTYLCTYICAALRSRSATWLRCGETDDLHPIPTAVADPLNLYALVMSRAMRPMEEI
jgi:hypothetical protein